MNINLNNNNIKIRFLIILYKVHIFFKCYSNLCFFVKEVTYLIYWLKFPHIGTSYVLYTQLDKKKEI